MCAEETFLIYNDKNSLLVNIFVQTMIFFFCQNISWFPQFRVQKNIYGNTLTFWDLFTISPRVREVHTYLFQPLSDAPTTSLA